MYSTPYTSSGKAHGELDDQCIRRTVLTTAESFPYVKKRIRVFQEDKVEVSIIDHTL